MIADLTCDSDGRIDSYVDAEGVDVSLPLHALTHGRAVPARHLPGRRVPGERSATSTTCSATPTRSTCASTATAAIDSRTSARGDTTDVMLDYVGYDLGALRAAYREKIAAAGLQGETADRRPALEAGLTGYTYLDATAGGVSETRRYLVLAMRTPSFAVAIGAPHRAFLDDLRARGQLSSRWLRRRQRRRVRRPRRQP